MLALFYVFFFKQKTAYEMRISDWSSDVCSSDLARLFGGADRRLPCEQCRRGGADGDDQHRYQRRPRRGHADLLRQRQARRGRPLGRTETDPRRRAQVNLKSDPRYDETENEVKTLPALRFALLSSLGALALAACGDSKHDPAEQQAVIAQVETGRPH